MALISGTRLGPYEILAPIGAGGMGEVYKANDTRLDRTVAIKVLPEHLAESPERKARFEREAKAISQLNHPHICTLYDVGAQDGIDFIVMEYIEGETLAERLKKGALPLDKALEYGIQIADGLDTAHRAGIVHRDLKPANAMLTKLGIKLLDFGLARLVLVEPVSDASDAPTRQKQLTKERTLIGTLQYMSPEQVEGKELDARSDIFSLGALLYEMVTGTKAFPGDSQASIIASIMDREPPLVSQVQPALSPAADRIVKTCLEKDPDDRWQSCRDLRRELQWAQTEPASPSGTATPVVAISRRRWLGLSFAAATVFGLAFLLSRFGGDPTGTRVVVLMDSTHPRRIYDPATRAEGGTNADDLTDVLRELPVVLVKENTHVTWHREDEILRQNPELIVVHRSCFYDATFLGDPDLDLKIYPFAANKFDLFLAYIGLGNPRTKFLVYSRRSWANETERAQWVQSVEARFPALRGRVNAWMVPLDRATFRDPTTAAEIRKQVETLLDVVPTEN